MYLIVDEDSPELTRLENEVVVGVIVPLPPGAGSNTINVSSRPRGQPPLLPLVEDGLPLGVLESADSVDEGGALLDGLRDAAAIEDCRIPPVVL